MWYDISLMLIRREQVERLKSHERRAKVDRLDGQWARLSMGDRLDG